IPPLAELERIDVGAGRPDDRRHLAERRRERARRGMGVDEDEGPERLDPEGRQGEVALAEPSLLLAARGRAQHSVEAPGPGVIVALERAAVATVLQNEFTPSVAADVGVGPERSQLIADDDDRDLSHPTG